ncbi:unnamed protein product [Phaedon cochleariae]|uniref:GTPase Era, mitochondrial n=1 Tax=Phaedon cochleariae TaxID=80249 RepID=A0A9P0GLT0_PHACE|nr:unnamed protein product [Phaedon cochleariae]
MLKVIAKVVERSNFSIQCRLCGSITNVSKVQSLSEIPTDEPVAEIQTRVLRVAIIGMPNAGKSTLINQIMDRKVCATSEKVHTTRTKARAIFTEDDAQIIFVDTPGLVNEKEQKIYNLQKAFIRDGKSVSREADIIGVVHDVANTWTRERLDIKVIKLLEYNKSKPSFLVFNKVDVLKSKRKLLELTRQITENCVNGEPIPGGKPVKPKNSDDKGWPFFQEIFMVSALTGDGLEDIKKYLLNSAKRGKWIFPEKTWTDQISETVILNTVKATLLNFLPQEIPYQLTPLIEYLNVDQNDVITTVVIVQCPSARIAKLIAGAADGRLRQITDTVRIDLQDAFHNYVKIKIVLEPSPNDQK